MSTQKNLTKEQLIKAIEKLEKNPDDRVGILAEVGITAVGVAGAGVAASVLGATTASIPIITAVTGIGMTVAAAPVALVAGAAVAGGAAAYGMSQLIKDGGFNKSKRKQLLNEYKDKLKEKEIEERKHNINDFDKPRFYPLLKKALQLNLISSDEAHQLIKAVESGQMTYREACQILEQILAEAGKSTSEKTVTACPSCSQKLRAPKNLGSIKLKCPKCQYRWRWAPR